MIELPKQNIIFRFLDNQIRMEKIKNDVVGDSNKDFYEFVFDGRHETLYISFSLIHSIKNFFSLSEYSSSKLIIANWFEKRTGIIPRESIGRPENSRLLAKIQL